MALCLAEHVNSFTFCLRLVHFSSFSRWFSVPTFMHSYDSSPLFSIVGLACKRFTTFRLPKIINTLHNGSTMRAPARRAFHLLQATRQLTPVCAFENPTGSFSNNIYHWSDDKHIASFSAFTACGLILSSTMSQKYSFTFLLSTKERTIS
jgi:hypothetical protein